MSGKSKLPGALSRRQLMFIILLPIAAAFISLCIGRIPLTPTQVVSAIAARLHHGAAADGTAVKVVWSFRLPRIILACLVGGGLSAAGCTYQELFANPLAAPDTLGVASGAAFGAALGILLDLGLIGMQICAIIFGFGAVALTYLAGSGRIRSAGSMVLAGIMVASLFSALIALVKYAADTDSQLPAITYWLMGNLSAASYKTLALGAPLIVAGTGILIAIRWRLNLLPLSDDEARASGVNITALRLISVVCATAITAACVSMCGQVGWVGLLVPHICRMRFGSNTVAVIPASIGIGAALMIVVDTIARSVTAAEIPVSILTAIIGAPFFIVLMRRNGGWQL